MTRPSRHLALAALVGMLALPVVVQAQAEQWLQYRYSAEAPSVLQATWVNLEVLGGPPEGVRFAKDAFRDPVFVRWASPMVKSGWVWLLLDRSHEAGPYDRLVVDTDYDGDLGEEPVQARRTQATQAEFGPVKLVFQTADGPVTYHLNLTVYSQAASIRVLASAGGWYEGLISVDGKTFQCTLIDYDVNGTFNDTSEDFGQADRIRIDGGPPLMTGRFLELDQVLHELEVAQDGAFVRLKKAGDVKMGKVRMPEAITSLGAGGPNGQFTRVPKEGLVELPVGKYRVEHWAVARKADDGASWVLRGDGRYVARDWVEGLSFEVRADQEIRLDMGEPVISKVVLRTSAGQYTIGQELVGRLGERIKLTRNNSQPAPPKLRISNGDGTYDRTYNFSYG